MFIQTEITPNPANMKFMPDAPLLDGGTASFQTAEDAEGFSPMASALFAIEGVKGVFIASAFLIVSKDDSYAWKELKPKVVGALIEFLSSGAPIIATEDTSEISETSPADPPKTHAVSSAGAEAVIAEQNADLISFIETEITPNPATLKFLPGIEIMQSGTASFKIEEENAHKVSPLVDTLFATEGVKGVFFGTNFISVTKEDTHTWTDLKNPILSAMTHFFNSKTPLIFDGATLPKPAEKTFEGQEAVIVNQIKELIETRVRPAVAQDGGDIVFHDYDDGIVYLTMLGACGDCPSSTFTLKAGIENMLKYYIPEVIEVRPLQEY